MREESQIKKDSDTEGEEIVEAGGSKISDAGSISMRWKILASIQKILTRNRVQA